MGDVDHRRVEPLVQLGDLQPHAHAQRRVEVRQRLVEQEGRRFAHDRAADGHPLALAARQLARACGRDSRSGSAPWPRLRSACPVPRPGHPRHLQREGDVLAHRHVRVERVGLEHHRQAALGRQQVGGVLAVDLDMAGRDVLEPGDQPQQRGLAAARGADEDHELAVVRFRGPAAE